jgi:hypothetical protein
MKASTFRLLAFIKLLNVYSQFDLKYWISLQSRVFVQKHAFDLLINFLKKLQVFAHINY